MGRAQGPVGPQGPIGATGAIALEYGDTHTENYEGDIADEPIYLPLSGFNRTPVVDDKFLLVFNVTESGKTYIAPFTVLRVDATQAYVSLSGANPQNITGATDYNQIENIPVINQDLSASGFTPVANTYYRHTGATTASFTQGVIYLYDTAYHKLGDSGGGTTLNKYTFILSKSDDAIERAERIFLDSKGKCTFFLGAPTDTYANRRALGEPFATGLNAINKQLSFIVYDSSNSASTHTILVAYRITGVLNPEESKIKINTDGTIELTITKLSAYKVYVVYYNDTEII